MANVELSSRKIIKRLTSEGWEEVRQTGSHKHFKHKDKDHLITVPVHKGKDIKKNTARQIAEAAGWL